VSFMALADAIALTVRSLSPVDVILLTDAATGHRCDAQIIHHRSIPRICTYTIHPERTPKSCIQT
jgi:hypothetical protein